MSQQAHDPNVDLGHHFYQNLGQQPKFSWQPSTGQIQAPILLYILNNIVSDNFSFARLFKIIESPNLSQSALACYANQVSLRHSKVQRKA
jgi:hypothetical protein